jgi:hypothetical protein
MSLFMDVMARSSALVIQLQGIQRFLKCVGIGLGGCGISALVLAANPDSTLPRNPDSTFPAYIVPVLVVHYFPTHEGRLDIRVTGDWGDTLEATREKTARQTREVIAALEQGSRFRAYRDSNAVPSLKYRIAGSLEFLQPLPTWPKPGHRVPMTDYRQIMNQVNIQDWVENRGVKEVWIWGYHGGKVDLWESNLASRFGDVSNSDRDAKDLPVLKRTYTVYHYNYQRGTSEAVEDHLHQIEAILNHVDGRDRTPADQWPQLLFWGHFVGSDKTMKIVRPGCGWAHYPPNAERDYDWANPRYVETDMDDWKPDGSGPKTRLNSERWGGNSLKWFVYWMQHLPGPNNGLNFQGKPLRNWWVFIGDYDQAQEQGWSLVETKTPAVYR